MAIAVSLINMKGGVGKTTIAAQLAHSARKDGHRVLAVDLDPQSNLSQALMGPRRYVRHLTDERPTIHGWRVFDTRIRHSASYPRASREATSLWGTPDVRWWVCEEFDQFKDEVFRAVGLA